MKVLHVRAIVGAVLFAVIFLVARTGIVTRLQVYGLVSSFSEITKIEGFEHAVIVVGAKYEGEKKNIISYNLGTLIQPGSNFKLFTAAAALHYLGPDYVYKTELYTVTNHGKTNLYIKGYGDPTLTEERIGAMAKALAKKNIRINGSVYYDDSFFKGEVRGSDWKPEWKNKTFDVPVSALQTNDYWLYNLGTESAPIITDDPTSVTVTIFKKKLLENNVITPTTQLVHAAFLPNNATNVFENNSEPLSDIVHRMLTYSKSNYAETLVRTIGATVPLLPHEPLSEDSERRGVTVVARFVHTEVHAPDNSFFGRDGSGLSPATRVSGAAVLTLFDYVDTQEWKDVFWSSLSQGGGSGTLHYRLKNTPTHATIIGKTGTQENASSLSGKIIQRNRSIVFTIDIYGYNVPDKEVGTRVEPIIDQIVEFLDAQL